MTGKTKVEGGLKLGRLAAAALTAWLKSRDIPRSRLAGAIGISDQLASLVFQGKCFLSRNHRESIETFTEGAITVAMLEGKATPPKSFSSAPVTAGKAYDMLTEQPSLDGEDDAQLDAAERVFLQNMMTATSASERRKSAQAFIDYRRGKPRQADRDMSRQEPVEEEELIRRLNFVEARLRPTDVDQGAGI